MADEENVKPEDESAGGQAVEAAPATQPEDSSAARGTASDQPEEAGDTAASVTDGAEEAMDAIAANVKNRAAEIEDVLAEVSESSPPAPSPVESAAPAEAVASAPQAEAVATQASKGNASGGKDDEDEPNLQISVGGETLRISTAHPLIEDIGEQLQKSQRYTLYSVGALCIALLAAVLFYMLMAAQLSAKVKEIDSMLGAMAKRTLQMTKGIESFNALENRLEQGLANQLMLQEMLAANEIAMGDLDQQLGGMPGLMGQRTDDALAQTQQALQARVEAVHAETKRLLEDLQRTQRSLDEQKAAVGSLGGIRRELSELRGSMQSVEKTVADLYIIERARLAKQVRDREPVGLGE